MVRGLQYGWLILVCAAMLAPAVEPEKDLLTYSRQKYLVQLAKLSGRHRNQMVVLRDAYLKALAEAEKRIQTTGKLDAVMDIRKERKRFVKRRGSWALGSRGVPVPAVKPVYEKFSDQARLAEDKYAANLQRLQVNYRAYLDRLKKHLTVQGQIDDAVRVDEALKGIEAITLPENPAPCLADGQQPKEIKTPAELMKHLSRTRWKLLWMGGPAPKGERDEIIEFHHGAIVRMIEGDGTDSRGKGNIGEDLSLVTSESYSKTLHFDPSFTTFNLTEKRSYRKRRGILLGSMDAKTAGAESLNDALVLYYPLDEVSEMARDHSGNRRDARAIQTSTVHFGKKKNAYQFDGKQSRLEITGKLDPDDYEALSISVWFKTGGEPRYTPILGWDADGEYGGTYLQCHRGEIGYQLGSGEKRLWSSAQQQKTYKTDDWNHVVLTHDRNAGNLLYINGELAESLSAKPLKNNGSILWLGSGGKRADGKPNPAFAGWIDEFMVFKRALSPDEVQSLYELKGVQSKLP